MNKASSWTGLFGSRPPKRKPDPQIRWFGKLPTYADYYCSETDQEWAVEFNEWMLEGFEMYLSASREARADDTTSGRSSAMRRLPLTAAVIRLPQSGMTVFASIQDYGGDMVGRPFPLCFYVGVPTLQWPGPTSDRLAGATRVLDELTQLGSQVVHFLNKPGGFKSVFDERKVDLRGIDDRSSDDSWVQAASGIPMADWFDAAGKEPRATDLGGWLAHAARWGDRIAALESDGFEPTLCFPLARGINPSMQTAGWIRWLESRMNLRRRALSLLLTGAPGAEPRRLVVIARDLSPEDFLLLTPLWDGLRFVDDLAREDHPATASQTDAQPAAPTTDAASSGSWADFVQAAAKAV